MKDFKATADDFKKTLAELNKFRTANKLNAISNEDFDKMKTRTEGGNGFMLGETIHLTGEVEIVLVSTTNNQGEQVPQNTFFGAKLDDGRSISLRNLIKPNLAGYKFEGTFKEDNGKKGANLVENEYTAKAVEDFDPVNVNFFDAETRNVLELYMAVKAQKKKLPNHLKLVAQGCRPIVATREVSQGTLDYAKGAHRVMRINVWEVQ